MNPYLIIGALLAAIGLAGAGYYEGHHVEELAFDAYKAKQGEHAEKQIAANTVAVSDLGASEADGLRTINSNLQEQNDELSKARDAAISDRDQLAQRLQHYVTSAGNQATGVPKAGGSTGSGNGSRNSSLSIGFSDLTGWIGNELFEADQLAVQLTAAQQVIAQDRQICNGTLPGVTK